MFEYAAKLVRVVDGDTIWVDIDLGFRVWYRAEVRLAGINCPESTSDAGRVATRAAEGWWEQEGPNVTIKTSKPDKYGRWLAQVVARSGRDLAADLIAAGHAVSWNGKGARP